LNVPNRASESGVNGHDRLPADNELESSVNCRLDEVQARYHALVDGSSDLMAKLDSAVRCCGTYEGLGGEVGRALAEAESLVGRGEVGTVGDSEVDVRRQLETVTTAAQSVAALGTLVTELDRAGLVFTLLTSLARIPSSNS